MGVGMGGERVECREMEAVVEDVERCDCEVGVP